MGIIYNNWTLKKIYILKLKHIKEKKSVKLYKLFFEVLNETKITEVYFTRKYIFFYLKKRLN